MRLIHSDGYSGFSLSLFHGRQIPPYAILSHTWGADDDEVSFEDLSQYSGLHWAEKPGYKKLQFCARRAAAHGLQYFWVDTCCINKSSGPELSEAINSMYRWYQGAARCYVYLSDFEMRGSNLGSKDWKRLRNSRWFTRGWTLQELLAPQSADFYDATGKHLGDKNTLSRWLSDTTGIPVAVLRDRNWRHNSVEEILSWAQHRQTKREEDGAYSLLGIFDISMSLIYGEGRDKAYRRLFKKIESSRKDSGLSEKYSQYLPSTEPPDLGKAVGTSVDTTPKRTTSTESPAIQAGQEMGQVWDSALGKWTRIMWISQYQRYYRESHHQGQGWTFLDWLSPAHDINTPTYGQQQLGQQQFIYGQQQSSSRGAYPPTRTLTLGP